MDSQQDKNNSTENKNVPYRTVSKEEDISWQRKDLLKLISALVLKHRCVHDVFENKCMNPECITLPSPQDDKCKNMCHLCNGTIFDFVLPTCWDGTLKSLA